MVHLPKKRVVTWGHTPKSSRTPHIKEPPPSDARAPFVWKVSDYYIDYDYCELGWTTNCKSVKELLNDVIKELQTYEGLTWQKIREMSESNHSWEYGELPPKLRQRLDERGLDLAELFQIILGRKPRIWGYKDIGTFYLMWYDPDHSGCKVKVK